MVDLSIVERCLRELLCSEEDVQVTTRSFRAGEFRGLRSILWWLVVDSFASKNFSQLRFLLLIHLEIGSLHLWLCITEVAMGCRIPHFCQVVVHLVLKQWKLKMLWQQHFPYNYTSSSQKYQACVEGSPLQPTIESMNNSPLSASPFPTLPPCTLAPCQNRDGPVYVLHRSPDVSAPGSSFSTGHFMRSTAAGFSLFPQVFPLLILGLDTKWRW